MQFQSNNLNKVRVLTLYYIEILLQVVFRIWFCIPALHCTGNIICARVDFIQFVFIGECVDPAQVQEQMRPLVDLVI